MKTFFFRDKHVGGMSYYVMAEDEVSARNMILDHMEKNGVEEKERNLHYYTVSSSIGGEVVEVSEW